MPGVLPIPAARLIKLSQSHTRSSILFPFLSSFYLFFGFQPFLPTRGNVDVAGLSIKLEASMQTE